MAKSNSSATDQILDLLLEALQVRQREQNLELIMPVSETAVPPTQPDPIPDEPEMPEEVDSEIEAAEPETAVHHYEKLPTVHLEKLLGRLLVGLLLVIIIVNIPYNRYGTNLARAMPDTAALVIRDGVLLKGSGDKVYVLEDNQRRWITTLDAFEWYGYRWEQVHQVEDAFLDSFPEGRPVYLLLKCRSPHVYALEDGRKRWIKDIPTFEAQGFIWQDIRPVDCTYLRNLPDGLPIPEDAGEPPQPH